MKKLIAVIVVLFLTSCENKSITEGLASLNESLTLLEAELASIDINATIAQLEDIQDTVAEMQQESTEVNALVDQVQTELIRLKAEVDEFDVTGTNEKLEELKDKLVKVKEGLIALTLLLDDDLDGIVNAYDACPDTEEGAEVNLNGCSDDQLAD
jgi:chromosome segregation ATPase